MPLEAAPGPVERPIDLYFDDFRPGQRFQLGGWLVTQEEILEFALKYDPQPFHRDPELARTTAFQGLIASGWQTAGFWMRLYCEEVLLRSSSLGSPGIQEVRWLAPVRPGDRLTGEVEVVEVRPSARHPERGTVVMRGQLWDQLEERKMRMAAFGLFGRRPGSAGSEARMGS